MTIAFNACRSSIIVGGFDGHGNMEDCSKIHQSDKKKNFIVGNIFSLLSLAVYLPEGHLLDQVGKFLSTHTYSM